jgi:hypothetical protein
VLLPPAGRVSYQLGGAYRPPAAVTIVDRDGSDPPDQGRYSICYINAYQAQPDAVTWWQHHYPDLLLRDRAGALVTDRQWNEPLLAIDTATRRAALLATVGTWIDHCAAAGYQAVEADNLDSYTRSHGLLTAADALAYARLLTVRAHRDRLAIAQKNAVGLSRPARAAGFDFAVAEECQVYHECDSYTSVYGRHVIEVEYTDQPASAFIQACRERGAIISITRRDRDLLPAGQPGHTEQWCPAR